ncbi:hypothetical protein D4764_10G0004350 [Takifugu flavidus]|uniref:C2H2-type domain-containing protein n=1 Tax=Takifugu flavidus TaxID=433684 RepID=A0A5C6PJ26_9TELE|nr:hypothetical protein D4764_10G0004350 [Takifugu flavidus]
MTAQQAKHTCQECGLEFTCPELFNTHLHLHALKEEGEDSCPRLDDDDDCDGDDETGGTDTGGGAGDSWEMSAKKSVALLSTASINGKVRNVYSCLVCGKVYTYQVPFLKHQLQHKLNSMAGRSRKSGRYECSICGVTFIRKERLRIHTRLHTKVETRRELLGPELHQCDQCGRTFSSTRTWAAHMELHKQHLFWCLSCSRGFPDEIALDKHLQGHNRKQHTCKICRKGFAKVTELEVHYKSHTAAKVYQCTMCSKSFSFLGNLILHRSKHLRVFPGGDARMNKRSSKAIFRKGRFPLNRNEKQGRNEPEAAEEGNVDSEGSDCGEPTHQSNRLSTAAPTAGQELGTEAGGAHVQREHKYWEWDCCVCDMGFDEVGKLHLHYVKHATGELPIPQEYI